MKYFSLLWLLICSFNASAQLPTLAAGSLKRYENFPSKYVAARNVDVWMPDGYDPSKKYPVIYMQDGQMLFDSTVTWNKLEWQVDEILSSLIKEKKISPCIVVGIWNTGAARHTDYFPQRVMESLTRAEQDTVYKAGRSNGVAVFSGKVHSDDYLRFMVYELKPFIDSNYSTYKDRAHTMLAGSSMGGLISLYAICEYPEVFGAAACLSTHWPGIFSLENNPIPAAMMKYLQTHLPSPKDHRIYFDYGTATLDAWYKPFQQKADAIMKKKGYNNRNWMTREFPGEEHSERAWGRRLRIPVIFLLQQ